MRVKLRNYNLVPQQFLRIGVLSSGAWFIRFADSNFMMRFAIQNATKMYEATFANVYGCGQYRFDTSAHIFVSEGLN